MKRRGMKKGKRKETILSSLHKCYTKRKKGRGKRKESGKETKRGNKGVNK
jgi:hypothetical protein